MWSLIELSVRFDKFTDLASIVDYRTSSGQICCHRRYLYKRAHRKRLRHGGRREQDAKGSTSHGSESC